MKKTMKKMKKVISFILALALIFSFMSQMTDIVKADDTDSDRYEAIEISKTSLNGNAIWGATESSNGIEMDNYAFFYSASHYSDGGLPVDGKLVMPNSKVPYFLAIGDEAAKAYDGNDCIRLTASTTSVKMELTTIGVYESVYVLATAGGPGTGNYADFKVTLEYTDGSTGDTEYKLYDWYDLTDVTNVEKYYNVRRINVGSTTIEPKSSTEGGPVLHSAPITVDKTKLLKSITFTMNGKNGDPNNMSGLYCCVFAVTGATPEGVPAKPTANPVTKVEGDTTGKFTASWNEVSGATSYVIDVATDRKFTNIVSSFNNLNVGNVDSYEISGSDIKSGEVYYYRVRAVNDNGQSLGSNRVASDLPIWIKNAINDSDKDKIVYDAETNEIKFIEDVELKDTITLPDDDATIINLGSNTVTAPAGKPALAATGSNVELSVVGAAGSEGNTGSIVANKNNDSGNGASTIDFSKAGTGSTISIANSSVVGGNAPESTTGNAGAGGSGIVASNNVKIEVGENATVAGGNGGNTSSGNGGNGGDGITGGNVSVSSNGTVTGGNGGSSLDGNGGNGGSGVKSDSVTSSGSVSGGNGGNGSTAAGTGGQPGVSGGTAKPGTDGKTHAHQWKYVSLNNVVKAYCESENNPCDYHGEDKALVLTLTIDGLDSANSIIYTGNAREAGYTDYISSVTKAAVDNIYYVGTGSTTYSSTTDAPINVGTYKASVSIGDATAEINFEIKKADITFTEPSGNENLTYNGTAQGLTKAASATGGEIYYRIGSSGTWSTTAPTATDAGTYHIEYLGNCETRDARSQT